MARRFRIPRHIEPGTTRSIQPGTTLELLILATHEDECFSLDLRSGAFVRAVGAGAIPTTPPGLYPVLRATLVEDPDPSDPARPELARIAPEPTRLGEVRARRVRRLLDSLCVPDRPGATILGTRGPSLAYVDLDGTTPSLVLVRVARDAIELVGSASPALSIRFGGVTQSLPIVDRRAVETAERTAPRSLAAVALTAELGFRPGYLLIGLGPVREGHVAKLVLSLLARQSAKRGATSEVSPPPDPRPSPSQS